MECSSPNSQRDARCHLSEMELTRQRLVTFLREEMCAAVMQAVEAPGQKCGDCRASAALNACRSKRSAESSVWAIQRFVAKPRTQLLISSGTFVTRWFAPTSWSE